MFSPDWLEAIKARVEKATPGPWTVVMRLGDEDAPASVGADAPYVRTAIAMCPRYGLERFTANDGPFIAHAREDIPRLLRAVEVLGEALEREAAKECEHTRNKTRVCTDAGHPPIYWCNPCRARRALADVREG